MNYFLPFVLLLFNNRDDNNEVHPDESLRLNITSHEIICFLVSSIIEGKKELKTKDGLHTDNIRLK